MYVLDKLWRDGISPSERYVRPGSEYQKASTRRNEEMERLLELLSPEAKAQMDVVETLRYDLTMLSEEDVFIYGFRLGARLMLDIMGEHRGQFQTDTAGD
ncbi:MAG: hypothetical protein IJZ39_05695 [Oscillospiraceae bacterium]|nr:hypothetical protein [Oscillospiraceae bacterium]